VTGDLIQFRRASGSLGAFVEGVGVPEIVKSEGLFNLVYSGLLEHEVLFFEDQEIPASVLEQFAGLFGSLLGHGAYDLVEGTRAIQILESTKDKPSKIEVWHSDMTFMQSPPTFTMLHSQIIPSYGGDTMWASARAAYDALSSNMKVLLEEIDAEHDFRQGFKESLAEPGGEDRLKDALAQYPKVVHPVVLEHPEIQKKSLFVNALFTSRILELSDLESSRLLAFLFNHIVTEEFTVRLQWKKGTLVIWDNRTTQHKPVNDFFPQHRLMHRVTVS
tara:strand:+ start:1192 stop:2016 length:825 start_codon:yes stop_codon:yes gene_type:complete